MASTARDIMQTSLITISPEESLKDAHRVLVEEEISGAPVLDINGRVVGVVSAMDLLRAVTEESDTAVSEPNYFRENLEFSGPDWGSIPEDFQDRMGQRSVSEVMTREVVTVTADAPIAEVARTLRHQRIHRLLVEEEGRLVGLITTFDLVGLLEKHEGDA